MALRLATHVPVGEIDEILEELEQIEIEVPVIPREEGVAKLEHQIVRLLKAGKTRDEIFEVVNRHRVLLNVTELGKIIKKNGILQTDTPKQKRKKKAKEPNTEEKAPSEYELTPEYTSENIEDKNDDFDYETKSEGVFHKERTEPPTRGPFVARMFEDDGQM